MTSNLTNVLRRLNIATKRVAINHQIRHYPVSPVTVPMSENELLKRIGEHINFLEAPHLAYLVYPLSKKHGRVQVRRSAGQPSCAPGCSKN